jgi:hypothetical protein
MSTRSHSNLSIIEAVETLSSIADLEFDREIGIAQKHEVVLDNQKINYKTVHWLHKEDANATVNFVKETFRVVLHYLRQFYKRDYSSITDQKTIDGIKTIMVLVGEAAKKLDRYTTLFHQTQDKKSVTDSKEYKQLQEFYFSKIAPKVDEGMLGKWILGLELNKKQPDKIPQLRAASQVPISTKHVFVDLETVKKDTEYELFFIRKEDGSRFFSPRLLRNIKLVCDFRTYFGNYPAADPLEHLNQWLDRSFHLSSRNILKALGSKLEHFYCDLHKVKNNELVVVLNKTLMALLLSSHTNNLLRHNPIKSCTEYFQDFQLFLREALHTKIYQKFIAYPPKETNHIIIDLLDLVHSLCRALYINLQGMQEMNPITSQLITEAVQLVSKEHQEVAQASNQIWNRLAADYNAMVKLIKRHPNGPLLKMLDVLEEKSFHLFDPLVQHNIPNQLFDLHTKERRISHVRFPAPIYQEFIHKAKIVEEFRGFLRSYRNDTDKRKHLLINLQDRTSWREHARCRAIENLEFDPQIGESLCVVTLATDTDFYNQLAPYHQFNHADIFIEQFKEHLKGEGSGFYFSSFFNKAELFNFIDQSMGIIQRIFFSGKNVLLRERRLDFIEIFYLLLQLKLIEWVNPDSFSLTCKDCIDTGASYSVMLGAFLMLLNDPDWTESDINYLNFMLYAPALLIRERTLLPERFNRMISALRTIENARQEAGEGNFSKIVKEGYAPLFKSSLLDSKLLLPR